MKGVNIGHLKKCHEFLSKFFIWIEGIVSFQMSYNMFIIIYWDNVLKWFENYVALKTQNKCSIT